MLHFLRQDWPETDPEGLARRLSSLSETPVTVLRPMNPRQWVVVLNCGTGSCEAATQRLESLWEKAQRLSPFGGDKDKAEE